MAKSLEEHLYRSATTKEEYLDFNTLKLRLQSIAQGLEIHRSDGPAPGSQRLTGASTNSNALPSNRTSIPGQQQPDATASSAPSLSSDIAATAGGKRGKFTSELSVRLSSNGSFKNLPEQRGTVSFQKRGAAGGDSTNNALKNFEWNSSSPSVSTDANAARNSSSNLTANLSKNNLMEALRGRPTSQSTDTEQAGSSAIGRSKSATAEQHMAAAAAAGQHFSDGAGQASLSSMTDTRAPNSNKGSNATLLNPDYPNTPKYQDTSVGLKKKVILQQQQRLLLLRHASKCKAGLKCSTKFCSQMVMLWKHMKTCRDKNCKTSHCLSSRCVLNHYRICKGQDKTVECEVCGPVMATIKQQDDIDENDFDDPLAVDLSLTEPVPALSSAESERTQPAAPAVPNEAQTPASAMLYQTQAVAPVANQSQSAVAALPTVSNVPSQTQQQDPDEQEQLEQLQAKQATLQGQLESLKQLQKQQDGLLQQQHSLNQQAAVISDPNSPEALQLQQQQMLLQQLQKRCQQQQLTLQQELQFQQQQTGPVPNAAPLSSVQAPSALPASLSTNLSAALQHHQLQQQQLLLQHTNSTSYLPNSASTLNKQQSPLSNASIPEASSSESLDDSATNDSSTSKTKHKLPLSPHKGGKGKRLGTLKGKGKVLPASDTAPAVANSTLAVATDTDVEPLALTKDGESSEIATPLSTSVETQETVPLPTNDEFKNTEETPPSTEKKSSEPFDKTTPNMSLISQMDAASVTEHLESLKKPIHLSPRTITYKCLPVMNEMIDDPFGWVFLEAVDPVALALPDYFDVIKNPMHLQLVKKKLDNAIYSTMEAFERDVKLVFENSILYNGETSEVGQLAQTMLEKFDKAFSAVIQGIETSQQHLETKGEACSLCGTQNRRFEPAVLYCRGKACMQRIKPHTAYYTDTTKQNNWCQDCFGLMTEKETIVLDDGSTIFKQDLQESKNNEISEEAWIKCDDCHSWMYQVCALFNGRANDSTAKYTCPKCYLRKKDGGGGVTPETTSAAAELQIKGASDLSQSQMSTALEQGVEKALQAAYQTKADELGVEIDKVIKAKDLTIRVVSNVESKHLAGDKVS